MTAPREDDRFVVEFAEVSAHELDVLCREGGLSYANEARHLSKACKQAAAILAARSVLSPALSPFAFGQLLGWIGLGNVDVVFRWDGREPTFVELKCGADLSACVWDAMKLAAGVLYGNASSGYLLAGAPSAAWEKPVRGAEFFAGGRWETDGHVRAAYRDWWWKWQEETVSVHPKPVPPLSHVKPNRHIPGLVAEAFETIGLGSFPFLIGSDPWELRLARIEPRGNAVVWKCVSDPMA